MDKIWIIFNRVRKEPLIFLEERSLTLLSTYMRGCQTYNKEKKGKEIDFSFEFKEFVRKKYQASKECGYTDIIRKICPNENDEEAFYKFYDLIDEFLDLKKIEIPNYEYTETELIDWDDRILEGKEINDMWNVFYKIREKPKLYLGEVSLKRYYAFWTGYTLYMSVDVGKSIHFLPGFYKYIRLKYGVKESYGYSQIIRHICSSDEEAFYKYYSLVEEFLEQKKKDSKVAKYPQEEMNGNI